MLNKNFLMTTAAVFVAMFVLSFVAYEYVIGGFMEANMGDVENLMKESPVYWQIIVGQLAGATLIASVLAAKGAGTMAAGFKTGACVGFLLSVYFGFMALGTTNMTTMNAALMDVVVSMVIMGAAGAAGASMMKKE